jgi:AbrB family looped-hinge helix DNA binding protein
MNAVTTRVSETGRMTVPASVRSALGLENGGEVVLEIVDGELHVRTVSQAMDRARALARKILGGKTTVDEFLADRRREAAREA